LGGTEFAAVGTGLLFGEFVGVLLEEQLESSFGQALCNGGGDLLHRSEIDIKVRPVVAECPLGNDFAPLGSQCPESVKFLGHKTRSGHGESCLGVASRAA
jgi:hypothetical protein